MFEKTMDSLMVSPGSFDIQSASTVFLDVVPVLLRMGDRNEASEERYMVRLLSGQSRDGRRTLALRVYIFSESDPQFLQTLEVSEDDFQMLKAEQGILVDFKHFSGKVTDLLRQCVEAQHDDPPKFRAVLCMSAADSELKLVETNDFKQIPHICLRFRCGSDSDIKSFLAFRLEEMRLERDLLLGQVSSADSDLRAANEELQAQGRKLQSVESAYNLMVMEATAASKEIQATAHRELIKQREDLICSHERENNQAQQTHMHEVNVLRAKVVSLEEQLCTLVQEKRVLEREFEDVRHRYNSVTELAKNCRDKDKCGAECARQNVQLLALEDTISALEKTVLQHRDHAEKLAETVQGQSEQLRNLSQDKSGLECTVVEMSEEVTKGNKIISDLTADLKLSSDKVKRKQAIILRQEEKITQSATEVSKAHQELVKSHEEIATMTEVAKQMHMTENSLTGQLRTCKKQLEGNEQMIRWLNSQLEGGQRAIPMRSSA